MGASRLCTRLETGESVSGEAVYGVSTGEHTASRAYMSGVKKNTVSAMGSMAISSLAGRAMLFREP